MIIKFHIKGIRQGKQTWVIMGMFLLVILVPTICFIWFLTEAVKNERMAVRQKMIDLYSLQVDNLRPQLKSFWEQKANDMIKIDTPRSPDEYFFNLVESGIAESYVIYDEKGKIIYPYEPGSLRIDFGAKQETWRHVKWLENSMKNYVLAAEEYASMADGTSNTNLSGLALQGRVRCLVKTGKKSEAIDVVMKAFSNPRYKLSRDQHNRLIIPDLQLLALQLMNEKKGTNYDEILHDLVTRLNNYGTPTMPPSQRLFLMEEVKLLNDDVIFSSLTAEKLAATYFHMNKENEKIIGLSKVSASDLWQLISSDNRIIALFTTERVIKETQSFIDSSVSFTDACVVFNLKDSKPDSEPFLKSSAGDYLSDWELNLYITGDDLFTSASERQISVYLWTAFLILIGISILAILLSRMLLRQMRLARLKNDIISTVSHELKTPLSSTRVLVDTLIDGKYKDEKLVKDYVELIAKENDRLSRLIENFLTFSRIENKKQIFDMKVVEPEKIAQSAYDVVKKRFESDSFSLELNISEDLPDIMADKDSMIMVLLNLLDNAHQYSNDNKWVGLRLYAENGNVCFEVKDKGIGLSAKESKKILDPFYQVDQTLSRRIGGCGLGLSIVKTIVDAHKGRVDIRSEKGKGSEFIIKIPVTK